MSGSSFTIRIFVPHGDPEGVRIIDRMNWTGVGIAFPRSMWPTVKLRKEFDRAGIYILSGYDEDDDLPRVYIGEGDGIRPRLESHFGTKDFWDSAVVFTSNTNALNKAHAQWLEAKLIERAKSAQQSILDNNTRPLLPTLSEHEEADVGNFLEEILRILPIAGMRFFDKPPAILPSAGLPAPNNETSKYALDTIVVPAQSEGFNQVFLGEHRWRAVRIAAGRLDNLKYVAAYVTRPTSAITHYAKLERIERYGENGKYQLIFAGPAQEIKPIPLADAPPGFMQGLHYTSLDRLKLAKKLMDLFPGERR